MMIALAWRAPLALTLHRESGLYHLQVAAEKPKLFNLGIGKQLSLYYTILTYLVGSTTVRTGSTTPNASWAAAAAGLRSEPSRPFWTSVVLTVPSETGIKFPTTAWGRSGGHIPRLPCGGAHQGAGC